MLNVSKCGVGGIAGRRKGGTGAGGRCHDGRWWVDDSLVSDTEQVVDGWPSKVRANEKKPTEQGVCHLPSFLMRL